MGQRFSAVLVEEYVAGESTPGLADVGALSVTNGETTFEVDARDLRALQIPVALLPRLLSHTGALPPHTPERIVN